MGISNNKWYAAVDKELFKVHKEEARLQKAALKAGDPSGAPSMKSGKTEEKLGEDTIPTGTHTPFGKNKQKTTWRKELENRIPEKVRKGLQKAFCKGFAVMFDKGKIVIEKTFDKDSMAKDQEIREFAIRLKGGRKEMRSLKKETGKTNLRNMAVTAVEGAGLGALGIGLPDIIIFTGMLLKGIYETAVQYGVDYEEPKEQWLILKMMEAAMSKGENWLQLNQEIDQYLDEDIPVVFSQEVLQEQVEKTAEAFAMDMLLLKFVQGLPVVGILGGAGNPVYYRRVMRYVSVKYQKRYLLKLKEMGPR